MNPIRDSPVSRNTTFRDESVREWMLEQWMGYDRDWFDRLWALHSEGHRHYHTPMHLWEMLQRETTGSKSVRLAIFFHDAIYDPRSSTNEVDSAELFRKFAATSQQDVNVEEVVALILATQHHVVSPDNSPTLAYFLDLDMAVLGKEREAYLHYASLVRKEYEFVPREVYCSKRVEVLEGFLEQPRIFGTDDYREALEDRARDNLRHEIDLLKRGIIPGE